MKKTVLITIISIGILLLFANCRKVGSCGICYEYVEIKSFTRIYSELNKKNGVYFIKGVVLSEHGGGNKIEVTEDLRGNFGGKSHISVWYCGYPYPKNDTLIMPIGKCEGEGPNGINYDYESVMNAYSILTLSNGYVRGNILSKEDKWLKSLSQKEQASILRSVSVDEDWGQIMPYDEFQKLLKTIKNKKL